MSAEAKVDVSVIIAARNEGANIVPCIESVAWAREVIVVENDSTDDTVALARSAGATVIVNPFLTIGAQRNRAIEGAQSDWILVVDADERASVEMGREIGRTIGATNCDAYRIPRRNFFLGSEVRHGGWERDRPVRLFRSSMRYSAERVHEHVMTSGPVGELETALTHEPYPDIGHYFEKLDRYSRWWAEDQFEKRQAAGAGAVVIRPPLRFLRMYVLRGGWRDGAAGAVLACMAGTSVMAKYARLWALGRNGGLPPG